MRRLLTIPLLLSLVLAGCVGATDPATDVTNVSATLNAHGHTTGKPATWWWEYSTKKSDLGTANDTEVCGEEPARRCGPATSPNDASLHVTVTGLTPDTTYWFRACGQDEGDAPVCAQALSFKTLAGTKYAFDGFFDTFRPSAVAVDRLGYLYLLGPGQDTGGAHQAGGKLSPTGQGVFAWWMGGDDTELNEPHAIAADGDSNAYITDSGVHRIQKFDSARKFVTKWGSKGTAPGQFNVPYGVATDALNNVYVVDKDNSRIQKFTPQGAFIRAWGTPGTGPGQFQSPQGIAIDPAGNVYVTDVGNGRVQRFDVRGNFLGQFAWSGEWIATDSAGSVYVSDDANDRVLKLSSAGDLIATLGPAAGDKALVRPAGVATDRLGNVYVADRGFVTTWDDPGALVKFKPTE